MASAPLEREGVVQDETTGELFIPASRRPDGSWRKPRRVKEGYVPQDEVAKYENKGVQWLKSKPSLPPGLNPNDTTSPASVPGKDTSTENMSKAAKKNAKRKEKKKQQKADDSVPSLTNSFAAQAQITACQAAVGNKVAENSQTNSSTTGSEKPEVVKKLRSLRKKLKQIEELERKIQSGELKNPEKDQLEKVAKKQSVIDEIEDLQLDLDD